MKLLILIQIILFFSLSCASVDIELKPHSQDATVFTHYSHYGLFGLIGSDSVNIKRACVEGEPVRVKNYFNFEDFLFTISTLGLYTPKSTKIWCANSSKKDPFFKL